MSATLSSLPAEKAAIYYEIKFHYGRNSHAANDRLNLFFASEATGQNQEGNMFDHLQEYLVRNVLSDPILAKYKPSAQFRRSFLKHLIGLIEQQNMEVNEVVFDSYIDVINKKSSEPNEDEKCFLILYDEANESVDSKRPIVIEQNAAIIASGTTGLHVWPACFQLMKYLKANPSILNQKMVLELGSGVGLLGLDALNNHDPSGFIFTDCHHLVLKQIEQNIAHNVEIHSSLCRDKFQVQSLDWTNLDECELFNGQLNLDLILATDIIFDPSLMPDLAKTLDLIWKRNRAESLSLVISSTIRNPETYSVFIKNLGKRHVHFDSLKLDIFWLNLSENFQEAFDFKTELLDRSLAPLNANSALECFIEILKVYK